MTTLEGAGRVGERDPLPSDPDALARIITAGLRRWPSAGVAVAVAAGHGSPVQSFVRGVADVPSGRRVGADTVFRVGSLTKTLTAVAVMQLSEQRLVDLDAPANDYLRSFQIVPARGRRQQATVRHLLTHTAGVGYWRHPRDLLVHPGLGAGVTGRAVLPPAQLYRRGLAADVEPGTRWAYSNHGFAALGQIVEDVSGEPFDEYLRRHVFGPLRMDHTDVTLTQRLRADLARGYRLGRRGLTPVALRPVPVAAGGGVYSTITDMGRYLTALLHGGANEHGRVLSPDSLSTMFAAHFRPDPRVAGMGLGFEPHLEGDRTLVAKGGTVNGFLSALELSPQDRVGVVVLSNTGALDNRGISEPLAAALTRHLLGMPADPLRDDVAPHPEVWDHLCGWYAPDAGPNTNLFVRLGFGAGLEVAVRRDHLVLRPLHPVPGMSTPMVLHPDDPGDPLVFRILFAGHDKTFRVLFTSDRPARLLLDVMSFRKRPGWTNPRRWAATGTVAGAVAHALLHGTHRAKRQVGQPV